MGLCHQDTRSTGCTETEACFATLDLGSKLKIVRRYPIYIFDLDGTLFRGDDPIPGAAGALSRLRTDGSAIRYLTNNSGLTREDYLKKLTRLGFEATLEEIYSSAVGAAKTLSSRGLSRAFVVGNPGLPATLREYGLQVVQEGAEAVVVGLCHGLSYSLLDQALQNLLQGAELFATNTDATYPLEGGQVCPGAGSIVAAVATCSGRTPIVIGKPNPYLIHLVLEEAGLTVADALVVGDRYDTDILAGQGAGCDTLLVLTGVTQSVPEGQAVLNSVAYLGS